MTPTSADSTVDPVGTDDLHDEPSSPEAARRRSSRRLVVGLSILALLFVVRFFVAEPVLTHGDSMSPTLHDGDALVIDHLTYRFRDPRIGEIVVATLPDTGEQVVKRVVAVAGDTIGIEDGVLVRNGVAVDEPYANQEQMGGFFWGPVVVPDDAVFLLGDNRLESVDSRQYGPLSLDAIDGRSVARIWPW